MVADTNDTETDFSIGQGAIAAYARLSYTMWHALGEFIDNSTQSRTNHHGIIDQVLESEGTPLVVEITYDRLRRTITISDNSIGMTRDKLVAGLKIAVPTADSVGRSRFGMGMKTAACWIGRRWQVVTAEWSSGEEWTATVDVAGIAFEGKRVPLTSRPVSEDAHYTKIIITELNRNFQARTEETIRGYLGSMYRFDIAGGKLKLVFNGEEIQGPEEYEFDTDAAGIPMKMELPQKVINGKSVSGWIGVLRRGGRKFGGFSLFQNQRQIQGFPNAWRPRAIFGGVDDEGANNLVSQRLTGVINFDDRFHVSHTKDAILFEGDEEEELEKFLTDVSEHYRLYAQKRRTERTSAWNREKIRDLVDSMKKEFTSPELKDAIVNAVLPPLDTIMQNVTTQVSNLSPEDKVAELPILADAKVVVSLRESSEYEPHLTIQAGAEQGAIHVIINGLHPYFTALETSDAIDECIRQYIYDAIAEYRTLKMTSNRNPDTIRRLKNDLLRSETLRLENAADGVRNGGFETTITGAQKG